MQREALRWILLILPRTVPTLDAFCRSELSATVRSCKIESQYSQSNVNFNSRHRSKIHLHHIAIVRCPGIKVLFFVLCAHMISRAIPTGLRATLYAILPKNTIGRSQVAWNSTLSSNPRIVSSLGIARMSRMSPWCQLIADTGFAPSRRSCSPGLRQAFTSLPTSKPNHHVQILPSDRRQQIPRRREPLMRTHSSSPSSTRCWSKTHIMIRV